MFAGTEKDPTEWTQTRTTSDFNETRRDRKSSALNSYVRQSQNATSGSAAISMTCKNPGQKLHTHKFMDWFQPQLSEMSRF